APSTAGPTRAPPGQTTTTWSPLGYRAQRPRRLRAEQVGVPSGISPMRENDPEVATKTSVIAVGWSLLWRSRAGGEWITMASPPSKQPLESRWLCGAASRAWVQSAGRGKQCGFLDLVDRPLLAGVVAPAPPA